MVWQWLPAEQKADLTSLNSLLPSVSKTLYFIPAAAAVTLVTNFNLTLAAVESATAITANLTTATLAGGAKTGRMHTAQVVYTCNPDKG